MAKRKQGRPARDLEVVEEEDDPLLYVDEIGDVGLDGKGAPDLVLLSETEERQVWAGFFSSVMCGAAASCGGEVVNPKIAALQADEMLREFRARLDVDKR